MPPKKGKSGKKPTKEKKSKVGHSTDPSGKKKVIGGDKIKRTKARADEELNEDGVPKWLAGDAQESKNTDVIIEGFNMTVPGGGAHLLNNTELRLIQGRHYGLIGKNGIGKSTLLRYIAAGQIEEFPSHLHVLHMEQEIVVTDKTIMETVLDANFENKRLADYEAKLQQELDEDKAPDNYDQLVELICEKQKEMNVWDNEAKALKILKGLGFKESETNRSVKDLSGGWRMRVSIASALFATPDILCLDEPTNHLDFPAVIWLQRYLKAYPKTLVIVSHDRHFINEVITDVIEFRDLKLNYYRGDYDAFLKTKKDLLKDVTRRYEAQQKQIVQWKAFCERFKNSEKESKQVQSRLKALKNMELIPEPTADKEWHFKFPEPEKLKTDATLLQIQDVYFGWGLEAKDDDDTEKPTEDEEEDEEEDDEEEEDEEGGKEAAEGEESKKKGGKKKRKYLLKNISAHCDLTSRVGMLGANGVGKSTLIKLIKGEIKPTDGKIKLNEGARTAVFTQHHVDLLKLDRTPLELLQEIFADENVKDQEGRNHLGAFGIKGDLALQKIDLLSGGQKSRVAFAILTFLKPHLIIMDEPTNHLDLDTIEALLQALTTFAGGVILVSHDQYFLAKAVNEFWGINSKGNLKVFHDLDDAKEWSYDMPDPDDDDDSKVRKKKQKKKQPDRERRGEGEKHQGAPKVPKGKKAFTAAQEKSKRGKKTLEEDEEQGKKGKKGKGKKKDMSDDEDEPKGKKKGKRGKNKDEAEDDGDEEQGKGKKKGKKGKNKDEDDDDEEQAKGKKGKKKGKGQDEEDDDGDEQPKGKKGGKKGKHQDQDEEDEPKVKKTGKKGKNDEVDEADPGTDQTKGKGGKKGDGDEEDEDPKNKKKDKGKKEDTEEEDKKKGKGGKKDEGEEEPKNIKKNQKGKKGESDEDEESTKETGKKGKKDAEEDEEDEPKGKGKKGGKGK